MKNKPMKPTQTCWRDLKKPVLIIEHCEPVLSEWLLLEYKHAAQIWDDKIIFTNVKQPSVLKKLQQFGKVCEESVVDLYAGKKGIVLDPLAKKEIVTADFKNTELLIVGGILGDSPPQRRTYKLITARADFEARNLGKVQLSIDTAVFALKAVLLGMKITDIEIATEVEIVHSEQHSTILPFGYPVVDSKVLITPGLVEYLRKSSKMR